jgi:hypothetical protein
MPFNLETIGRWLIILGISIVIIGAILYAIGHFFGWEKLPGTIRFQTGGISCIFPILGSIILSILLTLLLNFLARFIK